MKLLKRWLAFFVVVVLIIGVAFNSRGPLRASHIGEENTTTNETGEPDAQTAEEGQQQTDGNTGENKEAEEPVPAVDGNTEQPQPSEEIPEEKQAETPAAPEAVHQEAMELSQVMTGENGELICNVIANIPEGTFEANTSDVTMEVTYAAADASEQIKALMNKAVGEGKVLGEYFLYNVIFKVNGEQAEPSKEIRITFEQNNFQIKDTKKVTAFYYNEANSAAGNAEAEIVEIIQKPEKIEALQNAGESIDNIDDYDLSEISLREDGSADKIIMEGRRSTIYGCYLEEQKPEEQKPQEETTEKKDENKAEEKNDKDESLKYEDDEVAITVTAEKEGIIPANSKLQVVPIKKDEKDTKDQYKDVENKLQEKAEKEEYEIAGFLAYDISFVDADGNKVEPNGEVKVVMDYKNATLPEEVDEEKAKDAEVTVLHLEEDEKGEVKDVVDMGQEEKIENVETTDNKEVEKTEFKTESFSTFTIVWKKGNNQLRTTKIHCISQTGSSGYDAIDGAPLEELIIENSNDSNRILNIKSISESGINKALYKWSNNGTTYQFKGAYAATYKNNKYTLNNSNNKITVIKGTEKNIQFRSTLNDKFATLKDNNIIVFLYEIVGTSQTTVKCYTENGQNLNKTVDLKDVAQDTVLENIAPSINNYKFSYVTAIDEDKTIEVKRLRIVDKEIQYSTSDHGDTWYQVESNKIRFVYLSTGTIATANTAGLIDIALYDYEFNENCNGLKFTGSGDTKYNKWIGNWGYGYTSKNDNYAVQGIMDGWLYKANGDRVNEDDNFQGVPKLAVGGKQIITDLFSSDKTVDSGLNHLFTKDSNGYYEYNSATNYAYYNQSGENVQKNFQVYNRPQNKGSDGQGDFMPLVDIDKDASWYYGMTVGFNFTQPENGKINGNNMVFEFSGDDDVWVYVDGQLVLDIGGIHGAVSGSINFATGAVNVDKAVPKDQSNISNTLGTHTTLKEIFSLDGKTFEDYSEHRLEFIYLERGAGESNCHLKFNMPPIPKESLQVKKEITNTDNEKYANIEFSFKVYLQDENDKEKYNILPEGTTYQIWENDTYTGEDGVIDNEGIFKLKHGQTALFQGISRNLNYYAEEVAVSSDEFDNVEIPNWNVTYYDENGNEIESQDKTDDEEGLEGGKKYIARSGKKRVGGNSVIVFKNRCSTSNLRELQITKKMKEGQTTKDTFSFNIKLENTSGKLEAYSGTYYLKDADGYYYINQNGSLIRQGQSGVVCGTTTDGNISGIPVGYTVSVTSILSGTSFLVTETNLDNEKYLDPIKEIKEGTFTLEGCVDGSDGELVLFKNAEVTITNTMFHNISVEKRWGINTDIPENAEVYVGLFENSNPINFIKLSKENGFIDSFKKLEGTQYTVKELRKSVQGENAEFTIDGQGFIGVGEGELVEIDGKDYVVSYSESAKEDSLDTNITITNTVPWKFIKQSSSVDNNGQQPLLPGAEFIISSDRISKDRITYYGISGEDGEVRWYREEEHTNEVMLNSLADGLYTMTETKAPNGYSISGSTWKIQIANGYPISIKHGSKEITATEENIYYIENSPLYDLPSAGGPGTFWYTVGGTLLMCLAGMLALYKNKRKRGAELLK